MPKLSERTGANPGPSTSASQRATRVSTPMSLRSVVPPAGVVALR